MEDFVEIMLWGEAALLFVEGVGEEMLDLLVFSGLELEGAAGLTLERVDLVDGDTGMTVNTSEIDDVAVDECTGFTVNTVESGVFDVVEDSCTGLTVNTAVSDVVAECCTGMTVKISESEAMSDFLDGIFLDVVTEETVVESNTAPATTIDWEAVLRLLDVVEVTA